MMAYKSRWLLILTMALAPLGANSLGLGSIQLNSYLNERLDAEVVISASSVEEIESLEVRVASAEAFERFGLDRSRDMDNLTFKIVQGPGGSAVLQIRSSQPIVEPFVTFLIEASWAGGRFLREYTVLLDPPVFMPAQQAPQELAPPVSTAPSTGAVSRPVPVSRPAPQPARPARTVVSAATTYGPVERSETLWAIAQEVRADSSVSMNQAMVALFRANPHAFDGNINRLRAGATLTVPDLDEMTSLTRSQATAQVREQNNDWRGAAATPKPAAVRAEVEQPRPAERLELVPPGQAREPEAGRGGIESPADYVAEQDALNDELMGAVQSMRRELEETRDLISVKDEEIAALQRRLGQLEAASAARPPEETQAVQEAQAPPPTQPEVAAPPAVVSTPTQEDEGGLFSSFWFWLIVLLAAAAGGAYFWKQRQEEETYDSWSPAADEAVENAAAPIADSSESILVEEEMPHVDTIIEAERELEPAAEERDLEPTEEVGDDDDTDYHYPFEDTIAGAKGANLDQSDPLAEADFHMAYGLYDQAADLVGKAIEREPDRSDLRLKLLDILFVWGKESEFLDEARTLRERLGDGETAEWARVLIMGKQICPDEPLFEGDVPDIADVAVESGGSTDDSDGLDFDIGGSATGADSDALDFDLSAPGEMPVLDEDEATERTQQSPDHTAELEIEDLGLALDEVDETRSDSSADARVDEAAKETGIEDTLQLDDDTELATGFTEVLERTDADESREETGLTEMMDIAEAAVNEDTIERTDLMGARGDDDTQELEVLDSDEITATEKLTAVMESQGSEEEDTAEVEKLDGGDLDLDDLTAALGAELDQTEEMPTAGEAPDSDTLMEEIFGDDEETKIAPGIAKLVEPDSGEDTREMPTAIAPDVTLSEIGTKLDLARAYIDMGDPEGAKSILEEVVKEGDEDQQAEARKLVDDLG
jgi:pilus assembly protein FimV